MGFLCVTIVRDVWTLCERYQEQGQLQEQRGSAREGALFLLAREGALLAWCGYFSKAGIAFRLRKNRGYREEHK